MRSIEKHELALVAGGLQMYDDGGGYGGEYYDGGDWSFSWDSGFDAGFEGSYFSDWGSNVAGAPDMQGGFCSPENPLGMLFGEQSFENEGVYTDVATTYDPGTGLTMVSTTAESESGFISMNSWYDVNGTLTVSTIVYGDGDTVRHYSVDESGAVVGSGIVPIL